MASINQSKLIFFIVLIISSFSHQLNAILPPPWHLHYNLRTCGLNKVFQFGDSLNDAGNLLREPIGPLMMFSRWPYGETFFHKPTGRCSNGLLIVDFIAWAVGVPFIPPYRDTSANFENGVNFAVGGASALSPEALKQIIPLGNPQTNSTLNVQVDWFSKYLSSICTTDTDCSEKLKDSLVMLGEVGGNDYNYMFLGGKSIDDAKALVPKVVEAIATAARRVIQLGAPRVIIPGNLPIGCLPIYLTNFQTNKASAYDEFHCHKELNSLSRRHDRYLQEAIKGLQNEVHNATIVYADYYHAFMWMIRSATFLGLDPTSLQKACCGSGGEYSFDFMNMCGNPNVTVCPDPDQRVSWDGVHLTQKAYEIIAAWLVKINIFPNIRC